MMTSTMARIVAVLAVIAGALAAGLQPAAAGGREPWGQPMTVSIVRSDEKACEPLCPEWIMAEGEITAATPALFAKVLAATGQLRLPVVIRSPGGDMDAAIAIGRMIRQRGLDVGVGWTQYGGCGLRDTGCRPQADGQGFYRGHVVDGRAFCNSACPLVLAAGRSRYAHLYTFVGVHQVRTKWTKEILTYRERYRIVNGQKTVIEKKLVKRAPVQTFEKSGIDEQLTEMLTDYFRDMGVDPAIIGEMNKAPPSGIFRLRPSVMAELALTTTREPVSSATAASVCGGKAPADYCVPANPLR
jgi:hypothetical protein